MAKKEHFYLYMAKNKSIIIILNQRGKPHFQYTISHKPTWDMAMRLRDRVMYVAGYSFPDGYTPKLNKEREVSKAKKEDKKSLKDRVISLEKELLKLKKVV